jgi:uncharacterized protein YjbJ (UPF0337 family)
MSSETIKGSLQDIAGRVQDAVGGATNDPSLQVEGKLRKATGRLQQNYGEVLDQFRESAVRNPALTLAVVAGAAFCLGAYWARRD